MKKILPIILQKKRALWVRLCEIFFGNVYSGMFCQLLTKDAFLLGHKSAIILRINMGSNQRKLITIDLKQFKIYL